MMSLEQVIERFDGSLAYSTNSKEICQYIADLLKELKERRKAPEIITCGECKYKKDHHYEEPGEEPYIKSTCGNKHGLVKNYQVHDWDFCSRAERKTDGEKQSD